MIKHTTGPWNTNHLPHDVWAENGAHICDTQMHHIASIVDESAANARLISAAPELLKAVKELRAIVRGWSDSSFNGLMPQIEALIKKAEGGE